LVLLGEGVLGADALTVGVGDGVKGFEGVALTWALAGASSFSGSRISAHAAAPAMEETVTTATTPTVRSQVRRTRVARRRPWLIDLDDTGRS